MADAESTEEPIGSRARALVARGDRAAAERLVRRVLFNVNRGVLDVDGDDAIHLGAAAWDLELFGDAAAWARYAASRDLTPNQAVVARTLLVVALREQNSLGEAYEFIRSSGEPPEGATADALFQLHVNEAPVHLKLGEPEEALRRYQLADRYAAEATIDPGLLAVLEVNRGALLNKLGRNAEAIVAYRRALEIGVGNKELAVRVNLANALREIGRYDEAEEQYRSAYTATDDPRAKGSALSNYARLLLATGRRSNAKASMMDAFRLRGDGGDPAGQAITAEDLARLYAQESDFRNAHAWAAVAVRSRRSVGLPDDSDLMEFGGTMSGIVAYLDEHPDEAGHLLVDRLRAVLPADWQLATEHEAPATLRAALQRLGREAGDDADAAAAVVDRFIASYLDRVIAVGHQLASAELTERLADVGQVIAAVRELLERGHWLEQKRFYESAHVLLEQPIANLALRILELKAQELEFDPGAIVKLRELIAACGAKGIDRAFAELPEIHPGELINRFTMVGSWWESMLLVETHPVALLSDETIDLLAQAREQASPLQRARLGQHIAVLKRAREDGIQSAFAEAPSVDGEPLGIKLVETSIYLDEVGVLPPDENLTDRLAIAKARLDMFAQLDDPELVRTGRLHLARAHLDETAGERQAHLRAALEIFQAVLADGQAVVDVAEVWLGIGTAHLQLAALEPTDDGHVKRAVKAFRAALDQSPVRSAPSRARAAARGLHDAVSLYLSRPRNHSETVRLRQVRSMACRIAIAATDEVIRGGEIRDPGVERTDWLWAHQRVVEDQIHLGLDAAALAAAESGRGRGFLAEVSQIERLPQSVPTRLADAEARMRARLRAARAAGDEAAIAAAISDLDAVYNDIAQTTPELADLRRAVAPSADELSAFASGLPDGVVVLVWYTTATECFAFLVRSDDEQVRSSRTGIDQRRLGEFVRLAASDLWRRPAAWDQRISPGWTELAGALIPEVWRRHVEAARMLVLVPHGPLGDIPLHALPHRWLGGRSFTELVDTSYLPGLALSHRLRSRPTTGRGAVVMAHSGTIDGDSPFQREARAVAKVLDTSHVYLGSNARRGALAEFAPHAAVVHIAAHGVFNPSDPLASMILLSDGTAGGSDPFTARDVLQLPRLSSRIVVLSGCETSRSSTDLSGESEGLVRAFLVAGANAVVAGQWRVDSPSASRFMEHFHGEFRSTGAVAAALRTAALDLKNTRATQHPYYWAPFVVMGA
jgi:CHAT domain-containing protein/tetratricopeptide (TPR) repeat protein